MFLPNENDLFMLTLTMSTFPIFEKLGGREAAFAKLKEQGFDKGSHALRMWHQRHRIPGEAITLLMRAADANGIQYTAEDFEFAPAEAAE